MLRAMAAPKAPVLLASSSATGMAVTGTTTETALATVTIPAGAMGLNGGVEIRTSWTYTNSANNKTIRHRFGGISGTVYFATTATTSATAVITTRIRNRGAANSQIGAGPSTGFGPYTGGSGAHVTSAVDTSAAVDISITGELANTGETITLNSYEVWLLP